MIAIGIVLLIIAAVFIIVGGLAALRKLPGNNLFGVRVTEARESREAWNAAHAVAGPVWLLGGVALVFGSVVALTAQGWMWVIPVLSVIFAIIMLSVGGNLGARAAYLFANANKDDSEDGCCGGAGTDSSETAPSPEVDFDALRNAARHADD